MLTFYVSKPLDLPGYSKPLVYVLDKKLYVTLTLSCKVQQYRIVLEK